jgi:hypothetical protein
MSEYDRVAMARLEEKVEQWMDTTTEYRRTLCGKIDTLFKKFGELPCKERVIGSKLLWGLTVFIAGLLVAHLGWK